MSRSRPTKCTVCARACKKEMDWGGRAERGETLPLKGAPNPQKGGRRALWWPNRRLQQALTGGHGVPGRAARGERGWNAPVTDVYFCAQLGRAGSAEAPRSARSLQDSDAPRDPSHTLPARSPSPSGWGRGFGSTLGGGVVPSFRFFSQAHTGAMPGSGRAPAPSNRDPPAPAPSLPDQAGRRADPTQVPPARAWLSLLTPQPRIS